jgi:hypothetical protein
MPSGAGERYDFFLSRRGSVAAIAQEVTDVLKEKGYKVLVQDYDIPLGASFVETMHEAIIHQGECVGTIGVSGVQAQDDDEKVANAGHDGAEWRGPRQAMSLRSSTRPAIAMSPPAASASVREIGTPKRAATSGCQSRLAGKAM